MKLSVCLTINDRPPEISRAVANSLMLPGNLPDEVVVVLDRPGPRVLAGAVEAYTTLDRLGVSVRTIVLKGKPGWRCPSKAWNEGIKSVSGEILYCLSSETIQGLGSINAARQILAVRRCAVMGTVLCSCGPDGHAVKEDGSPSGNVFSNAASPRVHGHIWACHTSAVRAIGGFDGVFSKGYGWEDTDFFLRLWDIGMDIEFNDSISGLHICHEYRRRDIKYEMIEEGTRRNVGIFVERHGTIDPWPKIKKREVTQPGMTRWEHESE